MEELHDDPNLYALEEMMINHQWNDFASEEDFDDDELFLMPEPIYPAA